LGALSNETLFNAYIKARKLRLPDDFIALINQELEKRGLQSCSGLKNTFKV